MSTWGKPGKSEFVVWFIFLSGTALSHNSVAGLHKMNLFLELRKFKNVKRRWGPTLRTLRNPSIHSMNKSKDFSYN